MAANRQLYAEFIDGGPRAVITLYDDGAPKTASAIWNALVKPVRMPAIHAMFAGPEIMMGLPEEAQNFDPTSIPNENQTCYPEAGEILWFYQGKNAMKGLPDELWEIGIFYAPGARINGPLGWTPCNMFGKITEGLDAFAKACHQTRVTGIKTVEIGRLNA